MYVLVNFMSVCVCVCLCVCFVFFVFCDKCEEMGSNGDQAAQMDRLKKVGVGAPTCALYPHFKFKVASSSFSASLQNCTHFTCTQNSLNRLILSDLICFRIRKGEIKSMTNTKCRHKTRTKCVKNIKSEKIQHFEEKSIKHVQNV